jgi:hypothetical protein
MLGHQLAVPQVPMFVGLLFDPLSLPDDGRSIDNSCSTASS